MSNTIEDAVVKAHLLPKRQKQVLCCLARGLLVKETSAELGIATHTVKHTRTRIYRRLGVTNTAEAVRVACAAGLV